MKRKMSEILIKTNIKRSYRGKKEKFGKHWRHSEVGKMIWGKLTGKLWNLPEEIEPKWYL